MTAPSTDIALALPDLGTPVPWWKRRSVWVVVVGIALLASAYVLWQRQQARADAPAFVTEAATRGPLTLSVNATGTLYPTRLVQIGSELSGTVAEVLVDINDRVRTGQVLLRLDIAKLDDQVKRSRAAVTVAQTQLDQAQVALEQAQRHLQRLEKLYRISAGASLSAHDLDTARAEAQRTAAARDGARASLDSARATLSSDLTNLAKASLRSPIDGVVLSRSVDPGNAVAASLQAVTLFTIAEDLSRLVLRVNIDEADVGRVQVGLPANFTVSAFPSKPFPATITRVSYGSTVTDNVVTYTAELDVTNPDLQLRPGMTVACTIEAAHLDDALLVPNTAFRFQWPPTAQQGRSGLLGAMVPRMPRARKSAGGSSKQLWVLRDGAPVAVAVTPGVSDGRMTAITAGELREGMLVITDQQVLAPQ
ncbi:efflux RND transporter periplasmic adaptor subunit [Candidatus Symbiobacter mobilis]|uniref:HlyD family secretion protein n=1 Tax=Candidatus Symbiobacter mobilis CR TaxID=946483 RepID=U5NAW0_9BURK|nr:efflux RND transporter periplasmic adaptor subunit [Candidatus Symbiobacter mobilis]AGX88552.1 HlyD family secretion protein [Candidatus Symbiobacter mobilis CR]